MTTPAALRQDAQRNKERILEAAREAFKEHGLDAPLDDIARRAGVGIATLYRRFPTRDALIEEVFVDGIRSFEQLAEDALQIEDPWTAFSTFIEQMCERQAENWGLKDLMCMCFPDSKVMEGKRKRARATVLRLLARAQAEGAVRADVTPEDIEFVFWSNGRIVEATRDVAPNAWRRNLALMLDAFRAENAHPLPERALTNSELRRSMSNFGPERRSGS
jgi:AcrR family transcriptional regulator